VKRVGIIILMAVIGVATLTTISAADIAHIIGFGDSITSGRPYSDIIGGGRRGYGGYESVLEQLMIEAGLASYVYNWGYGGETTLKGVNRIDAVLRARKSHYVLIMEGTNDQWYGISADTVAKNLGYMIDKCRALGAIPLLSNLTPAHRDTQRQIPMLYNPAIADIALQKGVVFVDHYAAVVDRWDDLAYDPVHPNRKGYKEIAKTWSRALIEQMKPVFISGAIELLLLSD